MEEWAGARLLYLDNLKVILVAAIIAIHAVLSYSDFDWWAYAEVREVALSKVTEVALLMLAAPFALIMIPLLFLIAGMLSQPALARKGPGRFAHDRLIRLGLPFAVFVLVLWPVLMYALYAALGSGQVSYRETFLGTPEENVDASIMWFVGVLLIFSLAYAGWARMRHGRPLRQRPVVGPAFLLAMAGMVAIATFLVRLVFPLGSERYVDLNLFEWPACAAMFGLGIAAARRGWLTAVPDRLRRQCRTATLVTAAAFAVVAAYGAVIGGDFEQVWGGGWRWTALAFDTAESALAVFGPVWILGLAQQRLDRRLTWSGPAVSRSAYAAFILQGFVLIGFAVSLRVVPAPAEVKALLLAAGGVAGSYALAWLLIRRIPASAWAL
ncbi:MAG TPA: acyltransferase [Micromonosporaceae bacterium]